MPHSKRKSIRTIAWCLAVFAAVALIVTFPAGWGAWCATRIVRGLLADSGMTCEKVDWISPFSFEAHGFAMPGKPGEIRLNRVIANYSPGSLIREKRVKSLDAVGFSMDLADMLKPPSDALFRKKTVLCDAHVGAVPGEGTGMALSVEGDALDWQLRASAVLGVTMTNGFALSCAGRAFLRDTPWTASFDFNATTNGWEAAAGIPQTEFTENTPVIAEILGRLPAMDVKDLEFGGEVAASAKAYMTQDFPVPLWSATAGVTNLAASCSTISGAPVKIEGARMGAKISGIADHWDMAPSHPFIDTATIAGFRFDKVWAMLLIDPDGVMITESGSRFCDGNARIYAMRLNAESMDAGFTLLLDNIDAGAFLNSLPDFNGSATGRLHGKIPLAIHHGETLRFRNAYLYSAPGDVGKLQINDAAPITSNLAATGALSEEECDNLARALANLDYNVLRLELTRDGRENDTLSVRVEGTSTQGKTTVPVKLEVGFHGAIETLVNLAIETTANIKKMGEDK